MQVVPLNAVANQSMSFTADGSYWEVRIFQAISSMCADITINGNVLIKGVRCVEGTLVIPYAHLWSGEFGNLLFSEEPDWEKFDSTCLLYYLSNAEAKQFKEQMLEV